jgi:hypothetical protein
MLYNQLNKVQLIYNNKDFFPKRDLEELKAEYACSSNSTSNTSSRNSHTGFIDETHRSPNYNTRFINPFPSYLQQYDGKFNKFEVHTEVPKRIKQNKFEENTEILQINVKYKYKSFIMSLRRHDDLFLQTKSFFDSNSLPEKLIKPVLMKICESLNHIFMVYNSEMSVFNSEYLNSLDVLCRDKKFEFEEKEGEEKVDTLDSSILSSISEIQYSEETFPEKLNKSF